MTKLLAREYIADDFVTIEASDVAKAGRIGQPIVNWGRHHETAGPAATVLDPDGKIVFCFGVHHRWAGCGDVWAVYAETARRYPMVLRYTQIFLTILWKEFGYRRLQASVNPAFAVTVRFLEHLGFVREGVMRAYGPHGEDSVLYALIREGGC